jgi:hypothetical protein
VERLVFVVQEQLRFQVENIQGVGGMRHSHSQIAQTKYNPDWDAQTVCVARTLTPEKQVIVVTRCRARLCSAAEQIPDVCTILFFTLALK